MVVGVTTRALKVGVSRRRLVRFLYFVAVRDAWA